MPNTRIPAEADCGCVTVAVAAMLRTTVRRRAPPTSCTELLTTTHTVPLYVCLKAAALAVSASSSSSPSCVAVASNFNSMEWRPSVVVMSTRGLTPSPVCSKPPVSSVQDTSAPDSSDTLTLVRVEATSVPSSSFVT